MSVAQRVENLRQATGLTLEEIRARLDVSRGMFHYIRTGERNPSRKILSKLEAAERSAGLVVVPESVMEMDRIEMKRLRGEAVTADEEEAVRQGGADLGPLLDELAALRESATRIEERLDRIESALGIAPAPPPAPKRRR